MHVSIMTANNILIRGSGWQGKGGKKGPKNILNKRWASAAHKIPTVSAPTCLSNMPDMIVRGAQAISLSQPSDQDACVCVCMCVFKDGRDEFHTFSQSVGVELS